MHSDAPTRASRRRPVPWPRRRERDGPGERQTAKRRPGVSFQAADPTGLVAELEASDRFCRDTVIGRLYHPRRVSYREISAHDSLHVSVGQGNQVSAHVDRHSPLATRRCGPLCHYSVLRVAAHNVSGMAWDLWRVLRGERRPQHGGARRLSVDDQALLRAAGDPDAPPAGGERPPAGEAVQPPGERGPGPYAEAMTTYSVPGISCDHCKSAIEGEVGQVEGVERVEVDVAAKTVDVDGDVSDAAVRAAIDEAGYEVAGAS